MVLLVEFCLKRSYALLTGDNSDLGACFLQMFKLNCAALRALFTGEFILGHSPCLLSGIRFPATSACFLGRLSTSTPTVLAATFKPTSLIVIPRAHLADSTDYRCAKPSRFICYCPRNPRFHFFRHYTHWHRLASHRLLHFTGASWIRCPEWLLAFGHSTALDFFLCFYFPTSSKPETSEVFPATRPSQIHSRLICTLPLHSIQPLLQSSDLHAPQCVCWLHSTLPGSPSTGVSSFTNQRSPFINPHRPFVAVGRSR